MQWLILNWLIFCFQMLSLLCMSLFLLHLLLLFTFCCCPIVLDDTIFKYFLLCKIYNYGAYGSLFYSHTCFWNFIIPCMIYRFSIFLVLLSILMMIILIELMDKERIIDYCIETSWANCLGRILSSTCIHQKDMPICLLIVSLKSVPFDS